jgi:hypothetical protein
MHKEQTGKRFCLHRQMPASISHTHNQCENVPVGDGSSQNRSEFSISGKLAKIAVYHDLGENSPSPPLVALTPFQPSSGPRECHGRFGDVSSYRDRMHK